MTDMLRASSPCTSAPAQASRPAASEVAPAGAAPASPPSPAERRRRIAGAGDLRVLAPREGLPLTLRELAELYGAANPTKRDTLTRIRKWVDDFKLGEVLAWDITREQIETGARLMRESGYAISTCNRDVGELGTLYRWAAKKQHTPPGFVSPTLAIPREEEPMRVVEPARPGEWEHIRRLAKGFRDARFTLFVWLGMDTGARRGELSVRTWNDFDLDAPEGPHIVLDHLDTKTGKPRRLYFSHETAQLVKRLRPAESYRGKLVFVSARGAAPNQYRKPWARLCELAGRPGLHFHDLRHMVAADLLKAGKGMSQVAQMLGHSSLVLHRRYGHLDDAAVRDMQTERLGLDKAVPAETQTVLDDIAAARARHEQREASAADDAFAEAQRLQLVANEAMAAAMAAAQALAGMRAPGARPTPRQPAPGPLEHLLHSVGAQA